MPRSRELPKTSTVHPVSAMTLANGYAQVCHVHGDRDAAQRAYATLNELDQLIDDLDLNDQSERYLYLNGTTDHLRVGS